MIAIYMYICFGGIYIFFATDVEYICFLLSMWCDSTEKIVKHIFLCILNIQFVYY